MVDLDLTPIVEAVARARWERGSSPHLTWDRCVQQSPGVAHSIREAALVDVVTAAPLIERQVREQVIEGIRAQWSCPHDDPQQQADCHYQGHGEEIIRDLCEHMGWPDESRIARGGAS